MHLPAHMCRTPQMLIRAQTKESLRIRKQLSMRSRCMKRMERLLFTSSR